MNKRTWLISYNGVTLLAWVLYLIHVILHGFAPDKFALVLLAIAQGLAIFEILNALAGIAGTNWLLTTLQVFSRFLIVGLLLWIPVEHWQQLHEHSNITGFMLVTLAWSITEIVRAMYYLTEMLQRPVRPITFSRYTFFLLLYPLGVLGEFMIMFSFWEWKKFQPDPVSIVLGVVALSYVVFFPKLFGHMLNQRKKKLK